MKDFDDFHALQWRPWVPQAGQARMFRECAAVWGDPNRVNTWPSETLLAVCERGEPQSFVYDKSAGSNKINFLRSDT